VRTARATLMVVALALGSAAGAQPVTPLPFDRILRHE
jgi:hypothetical protein